MHEFHTNGRAIGAFENLHHFVDRGIFKPQNIVQEYATIKILGRKTVIFRRQFLIIFLYGLKAQRIEIGMEVPAHAIGADHHDGAHGITCCLLHIIV